MKSLRIITILVLAILAASNAKAQHDPIEFGLNAITQEAIKGQLDFLASDWTEGRETTTKGEFMAGDYISSIFQIYGLKPAGDMGRSRYVRGAAGEPPTRIPGVREFFQKIPFVQNLKDDSFIEITSKQGSVESNLHIKNGQGLYMYGGSPNQEITTPVVFIGYGYKNDAIGYDDFKGLDLKGKIVLRLSGYPGSRDTSSVAYQKLEIKDRQSFYTSLREIKDDLLKEHGVAGVIRIPGFSMSRNSYANYPFRINTPTYEGERDNNKEYLNISLPVDGSDSAPMTIILDPEYTEELLKDSGVNIKEYEENAANKLKSGAFEIKGKTIHLKSIVKTQTVLGRNVLAMIEGENPDEVIVVGAHYDHLGISNGVIYNGADDNASGTVGVMTLARAFMATGVKPKKTIIFAAWTGEEKGLLGSEYYVRKYPEKENIVLNLNLDMISRRPEQDTSGFKADMTYTEAYPILKDLVEKANVKYDLGLDINFKSREKPQGGTDYTAFSLENVPIFSINAAFTSDYHQASDHSDKVNIELMEKIIKAAFITLFELANSEGRLKPVE